MSKYKALAYIGVYQLADIGNFDTELEAFEALEDNFDTQVKNLEIPADEIESERERFWFDSRIEEQK